MFITRQPYYQRRKFNFTNNLTSKNYSNHDFLNSCGHLKGDIKLSTATS